MDFKNYYEAKRTYITRLDSRLNKIVQICKQLNPDAVLDIGCGEGFLLSHLTKELTADLFGVDVYEAQPGKVWAYKSADITKGLPYEDGQFNCVILGEVIEHVPNPDFLLTEIRRILSDGGHLIISTPNMVSWANRILVPLGIQPLFTETSSEVNLGRYLKVLGQGGTVQGHLKIFTHRSLKEILVRSDFQVSKRLGAPFFFPFPLSSVDRFFALFPSLASDLIYVAQKSG